MQALHYICIEDSQNLSPNPRLDAEQHKTQIITKQIKIIHVTPLKLEYVN